MNHPQIRLNAENMPVITRDGADEIFDFNTAFRGYYPTCRFTAAARAGGLLYLAGVDENGRVRLFTSLTGGVWDERNVAETSRFAPPAIPESPVIKILHSPEENQVFLVCCMGQLVTLPDCPKCVKIRSVRNGEVTDARMENGEIIIDFADGQSRRVPVRLAAQYRISETFAAKLIGEGAALIDLRTHEEYEKIHFPGAVNVEYAAAQEWLSGKPKDKTYIFICRTGVLSDEIAFFARGAGFEKSFSMGGMDDIFRIK